MARRPFLVPYRNPLREVRNLAASRIDMGVDYSGTGPVFAIGPGVVTNIFNSGWPGGNFICQRVTAGPLQHAYWYVAEDVSPAVAVGQQVDSGTVIGYMYDGGSGIETGFAAAPGTGDTAAAVAGQFNGSNTTAWGAAASEVLHALGAPRGVTNNPPTGSLPPWIVLVLRDIGGWIPGGPAGVQPQPRHGMPVGTVLGRLLLVIAAGGIAAAAASLAVAAGVTLAARQLNPRRSSADF